MAIRRATFERIKMSDRWRGVLSDDFAVMRAMQQNNLQIYFVPQCLIASIDDCSFAETLEFTTRQMIITRVYAAHFWLASLFGSLIFTFTFYLLLIVILWRLIVGESIWLPLAFLLLIFALGAWKARLRLEAVKLVLKNYQNELNQSFWSQIYLFPLSPPLYLYNSLCAAVTRKIVWRGIGYELKSPTETVIVSQTDSSETLTKVE
jgi:hypothetical protein